jgi:drug/metabolite transporter (DMT)-like permease
MALDETGGHDHTPRPRHPEVLALRLPTALPGAFVQATILLLIAIFMLDVMGAIVRHLGQWYPAQELSVFRNLFGLLPSLLVLYYAKKWNEAGRPVIIRQWRLALLRGFFVAFAQLCFYTSLLFLEFATAATLAFVGPLFITALSVPVLGERVGVWRWGAVGIGFVGVILIMSPGSEVFSLYALLPVGAAFFYASASVVVRRIDEDVPTALVNLYGTFGALVGAVLLLTLTTDFVPVQSLEHWGWLLAMGAVGGTAILLMIRAYRLTRPSNLAPFEYFGIPFSFVIGWIVFNEAPFDRLFPGALLIVVGGLIIVWRQNRGTAV